jgi:uncharacterized protein with GYD domain
MPQYMLQFAYTSDAWAALSRKPVDRSKAIESLAESLGGKLISLHYTMGDYDGHAMLEAPNDVVAMAIVIRAIGPGHLRSTKTTRLFTPQEAMKAMKKAGEGTYTAPAGK